MFIRKQVIVLAIACALSAGSLIGTSGAFAQTTKAEVKAPRAANNAMIQTADEAFKALREIQAARVAIFNGLPEEGARLTTEASADLKRAQETQHVYSVLTNKKLEAADTYIPFDTSIVLAEGFVPSEEKNKALETANAHLSNGEKEKAMKAMKLANIDLSVSVAMIPIGGSLKHVADAERLISEKKYYEANLSLKAVEDMVLVEAYGVDALPVQGQ